MLRALKGIAAAIARGVAAAAATVGKSAWMTIEAMSATYEALLGLTIESIKLPFNLFDYAMTRVFGRGAGGGRQVPNHEGPRTTASDMRREFRAAAERRAEARAAVGRRVSSVGMVVHDYASALPELRSTVSLRDLPEHVADWLLGLDEDDLMRLAKAGPSACSRAAEGRRCGVVGLQLPQTYADAAADKAETSTYDVLQARIRNRLNRGQDYRAT